MVTKTRDIEAILHEEFLRERAANLARASESLQTAIEAMTTLNERIELLLGDLASLAAVASGLDKSRRAGNEAEQEALRKCIDTAIAQYNAAREYALTRYYYLIVTREALGLRRHQVLEEFFPIGEKRDHLY